MPYTVRTHRNVAAQVARFPSDLRRYWEVCLDEIAKDPVPRFGRYVEYQPPLPATTYIYEIATETSISGERILVFRSEFLAEWTPVYVVEGDEVAIFYLRRIP